MSPRAMATAGALLAAAGVALGAFGAHGLPDFLTKLGFQASLEQRAAWFDAAVRYHLVHAVGLAALAGLAARAPRAAWSWAGGLLVAGIVVFSGSLYAMTVLPDGWRKLGMITPLGGVAFIVGWIAAAIAAYRSL